jgi:small subunit ribosomal protein S9
MSATKTIITIGTRKKAVARAKTSAGSGKVAINGIPIEKYNPAVWKLRMEEPLIMAGELSKKVNIDVNVRGGGIAGQVEAARLAIARGLVQFSHDKKLEKEFMHYDRQMLVADVRVREPRKPNTHGNARSKTQKSYR